MSVHLTDQYRWSETLIRGSAADRFEHMNGLLAHGLR